MATYGYLRVSTQDQDVEKFHHAILDYANDRDLGKVEFVAERVSGRKTWRERKLGALLTECSDGDRIIAPELSRLARSVLQIHEVLHEAHQKGVEIHVLKERLIVNGQLDIPTKIVLNTLAMIAELERDLISERTKEALESKRRQGIKLGRPRGRGRSKLDAHEAEIRELARNGATQKHIAHRFGTTPANLSRWMKERNIGVEALRTE